MKRSRSSRASCSARRCRARRADETVEPFDGSPGEPEGGSTDVADVSWNVPMIHLSVTTAPREHPLACVARGGVLRDVDRPQGNGVRGKGAGGDRRGPPRGSGETADRPQRVLAGNGREGVRGIHPARAAAAPEGLACRDGGTHPT